MYYYTVVLPESLIHRPRAAEPCLKQRYFRNGTAIRLDPCSALLESDSCWLLREAQMGRIIHSSEYQTVFG